MYDLIVGYPIGLRSPHIGQHWRGLNVEEENLQFLHAWFNHPGWLLFHLGEELGSLYFLTRLGQQLNGVV